MIMIMIQVNVSSGNHAKHDDGQVKDKVSQVECTPAQLAVMQGDAVCARMLLERGGLLATSDYTAAHLAAMMGHLDVMKITIDRIAMDMTAQDKVSC